jgi:hypothetical protein
MGVFTEPFPSNGRLSGSDISPFRRPITVFTTSASFNFSFPFKEYVDALNITHFLLFSPFAALNCINGGARGKLQVILDQPPHIACSTPYHVCGLKLDTSHNLNKLLHIPSPHIL